MAIFGDNFMPDNELMVWTAGVTQWIEWFDYVREASSWHKTPCPEYIKEDPTLFNSWLNAQKQKEQTKNTGYGRK